MILRSWPDFFRQVSYRSHNPVVGMKWRLTNLSESKLAGLAPSTVGYRCQLDWLCLRSAQ
jgi:hypothetical protein